MRQTCHGPRRPPRWISVPRLQIPQSQARSLSERMPWPVRFELPSCLKYHFKIFNLL